MRATHKKIRRTRKMPASEGRALDWSKAQKVTFPDLKASTETISLRMPAPLLHAIKRETNRRDAPYQSLIKVVLAERFAAAKARVFQSGHGRTAG